ncbi:AurF N-oxygenase family protein [Rhodococcoides corynebacterioides]|uniref:AurF N-oxygenase family protein n=1 Tax=Rhodococcoides corynebacterioides TaxID=53972 RepID=UPI001C9A846B|nr:diiron oxygenase [Rhodococcus corynebacterioides]MBY6349089.1 diiron oxygenase [Rhodococcus corynebacterioides]MBY6361545.1 diiron oxygenase [Rhodococcus corynebacterioides]
MTALHENPTAYQDTLRILSEASVERHFDAFTDIPWDDPQYAVVPNDPRWILPAADPLGATDWYRSLSTERQIEIGMYRQANIMKVGLQFEQILIAGLMNYAFRLPNGQAEFRYSTHEATEECHHTQMFQELVNRIGIEVAGGPRWFRLLAPIMPLAAGPLSFGFFVGVLAGEEPIDHVQKAILRSGENRHPLITRIMQIHVAEEARHIGFAHQYLRHKAPRLKTYQRGLISVIMPVIMRVLCDAIIKPTRAMRRDLQIPDHVVDEVWWDGDASRKMLRDMFGDVRMLADDLDLMNPVSRRVWRALGIDGRPSRFRSEPASAAA